MCRAGSTPAPTLRGAAAGTVTIDAGAGNARAARRQGRRLGARRRPDRRHRDGDRRLGQLASTARIDARGDAGGGRVAIGGGPHGKDPKVRNARDHYRRRRRRHRRQRHRQRQRRRGRGVVGRQHHLQWLDPGQGRSPWRRRRLGRDLGALGFDVANSAIVQCWLRSKGKRGGYGCWTPRQCDHQHRGDVSGGRL